MTVNGVPLINYPLNNITQHPHLMTHSNHTPSIDRLPANIIKRQRRALGFTHQQGTKPKSFRGLPLRPAQRYTPEDLAQKGFDPKYFEKVPGILY